MNPRRTSCLAALALAGSGLAVTAPLSAPASAEIIPSTPVVGCTTPGPRPCIVSATRDGVTPDVSYEVSGQAYTIEGSRYVSVSVTKNGQYDMGFAELTHEWVIKLDMGDLVPRVVTGKGQDTSVVRKNDSGNYTVTITGRPVTISGQCDQSVWPWTCKEWAADPDPVENQQWDSSFNAEITDYGVWEDAAQRNAMYGMNYFTNVAATSVPPEIAHDSTTDTDYLMVRMANRRFLEDGSTLVQGSGELRIPNAFLRLAYGVPNPELMTGSSLSVEGTAGGVVTVTQESGDDAMLVDISGLEFPNVSSPRAMARAASSAKLVRVKRGAITPTRNRITKDVRVSGTKAKLVFTKSKARGAKITGYTARCSRTGHTVTIQGRFDTIFMTGLTPGKGYKCQVRAKSKAGPSRWSLAKTV